MGHIDRDQGGRLVVGVESETDAAQLRVAIRGSDGADELPVAPGGRVLFSADNPFNLIALWSTDFSWTPAALRLALEVLVPAARSALHLHTRSHRSMMRRFLQRPDPPGAGPPATD